VESGLLNNVRMAKPDRPNFSLGGRILFGAVAIIVVVVLLRFLGYA